MRLLARATWILLALGVLVGPSPRAEAEADCFQVTREIRALEATVAELKSTLAKASPEAMAEIEKQLLETKARVSLGSQDLKRCWYTIHVHAVRVTDTCAGRRAAAIDPDQIRRWIEKANEVYAVAGVRFEFDPTPRIGDWALLSSTEANDLYAELPGDAGWERGKAVGNELASHFPGKLLALVRHGPGASATGGGFSSTTYNFVVLPSFDVTRICGAQNVSLFAHEVGHYFGMNHTFRQFKDRAAAAAALRTAGNKPNAFDADGLADTAPEPYIEDLACAADTSVTLNGIPFSLLRSNIMSYYYNGTKTLTPEQIQIVRVWVEKRFAPAMDGVGPFVPDERRIYRIASVESGKALEVAGASTEKGAKIHLGDRKAGTSQSWRFIPLTAQDTGSFEIVSLASGKCLTVEAGGREDGAKLIQWDWEGGRHQKWRLTQDERGDLMIEARHSRKILAVPNPSQEDGQVEQSADMGAQKQRWRLVPQD